MLEKENAEVADQTKRPVCLLVAGMHRGGTSACTRVISLMGAALPDNLMAAHVDFNPSGFWESNDVVAINEALLRAARTSWHDVLETDLSLISSDVRSDFKAKLAKILHDNQFSEDFFVLKDPRISKLLPIWISTLTELKYSLRIIIPVRNPMEVAASLEKRDQFDRETSAFLWLRYMLASIRCAKEEKFCLVFFDELLLDWRAAVRDMSQTLGIEWPYQLETVSDDIDAFLETGLKHHRVTDCAEQGVFMNLASRLYDEMTKEEIRHSPNKLIAISKMISIELVNIENNFLPVLRDYERSRSQLEASLNVSQEEVMASKLAQQNSYHIVQELEAVMLQERNVFQNLHKEFDEKCKHVEILSSEKQQLQLLLADAQRQLADITSKSNIQIPEEKINNSVTADINVKLDQIIELIQYRNNLLNDARNGDFKRNMQFNEAMTRADAQLDLLTQLFSIK